MESFSTRKSLLILLSVITSIVIVTFLISVFARGYRLDTNNKEFKIKVTGLLSATSRPRPANVYINNLLTTTTDNTVNLNPGNYMVKIARDGYYPWIKNIQIQPEFVSLANAQLFRIDPELKAITLSGIINPSVSPDGNKIIYAVASTSATSKDNGLYLLEVNEFSLLLGKFTPRLLSSNLPYLDWSKYTFEFSPNSRQIIASSPKYSSVYLFSIDQNIDPTNLFDVSTKLTEIKNGWQSDQQQIITAKLEKIPLQLITLIATNSSTLSLNSNEDKILYQAKTDGNLDENLISPPPTKSNQTQSRSLKKDLFYVYDLKEDTNFLIGDTSISNLSWLPNSDNLIFTQNKDVRVCEYDATNFQTIYTGYAPIKDILSNLDGYKIIISSPTDSKTPSNLYSLTIKDR